MLEYKQESNSNWNQFFASYEDKPHSMKLWNFDLLSINMKSSQE